MYCPRCGNQPASDRMRFCPSCGFRLDGVADLLARDGVPTGALNALRSGEPSERKKGIRRGAKMVFFSLAMFLPVLGFSIGVVNSPGPLLDRKSTRLNSSHLGISYAVFCLKKKI